MKTAKIVGAFIMIAALLLSGCSGLELDSEGNATAVPGNQVETVDSTMSQGEMTASPDTMGTLDSTASPEAMTTLDTTTTPEAMETLNPDLTALPTPTRTAVVPVTGEAGNLALLQSSYEQIYIQVNPSVVYIEVVEESSSSGNMNSGATRGSGSGFVWDTQGHIVTNNHVINGGTTITVTFVDGTIAEAKVVGQDPNADLAVLQVDVASPELLHPVVMGDSTQVRVGQIAIAIGNPFGLAGSMSEGIISALARSLPVESSNESQANPTGGTYNIPNIIQTDAAINPGNSGGVLVNLQSEVIGVTTAIRSASQSNSGIGFVIPSEIVVKVVPELISTGSYAHPWLGVSGRSIDPEVASALGIPTSQRGAFIIAVSPGGPAAEAGVQPTVVDTSTGTITKAGDIITAINGQPVRAFEDLGSYLFLQTKPGDVVTITVLRDGEEQTIQVTLGTLPTP